MPNIAQPDNFKIKGQPWWQYQFHIIGKEKLPLLIIDNFVPLPEFLIDTAKTAEYHSNSKYYPGVRADVPEDYKNMLRQGLVDPLVKIFGYKKGAKIQECFFSIVTTEGQHLNMVQRLPHVDGGDDEKVALLHYLCTSDQGGTAFYRQVETGFETVSTVRFERYKSSVASSQEKLGPPAAEYYRGEDGRFEKIFEIEAKMNRAVLYFGRNLHAINIKDIDEKQPRLTINTFINPV